MTFVPSTEQQAIIDHPLEPLRVVAGAGTGKTTTMAARLARLVTEAGVAPEQALGVTFTNKAAEELSDRVRSHLPDLAAAGRRVEVLTYHGFAHGILREYGALVGVGRDAPVVSTGYTRQLLTEALGAEPRPALDLTARPQRVREAAGLAGRLGDHLRTAHELIALDDDAPAGAARTDLARSLLVYADRKRSLGLVDYSDLVALAHELVTTHPMVAERVRNRYRVVLLDEYQDTNPGQRELLRAVFGDGFPVTAVGDPDQTIYEWRGASLENFSRFGTHFPTATGAIAADRSLTENRRSGADLVDVAEHVRRRIGGEGVDRLRALDGAPAGSIEAARLRTAPDEAEWIAERIHRLGEDGVDWRDIGILFRRHRQIALIREALDRRGIPVEVASLGGLLEVPEVADLHAWLRVLGRPDDSSAFARIVLGSGYRLGLGDLAPLAAWVRSHRRSGHGTEGVGAAVLEAIDVLEDLVGLGNEPKRRLGRFRARYRTLLQSAQSLPLAELCRVVLDATDAWLEVEALDDAARLSARLNLYRFLDLAEAWSPLEGIPSLEAFLDHLDLLDEDDTAEELETASVGGEDAVALLTVHRAKGLEWPVVVLPALAQSVFPSTYGTLPDPTTRPDHIPTALRLSTDRAEPDRDALKAARDAQEWRTAYVAVTRAKERLIATSAHWYTEKTARSPSDLHTIIADHPKAVRTLWLDDPGEPPSMLRLPPDDAAAADPLPGGWRAILGSALTDPDRAANVAADLGIAVAYDARVEQLRMVLDDLPAPVDAETSEPGFRTSVTGLVTYATCPKRFYWSEVDRLPRRPSAAMRRGIELHRRIELHNRGSMALEEATSDFYDVPDTPGRADPDGADPDGAGPDRAGPDRAGPDRAGPDPSGSDTGFAAFSASRFAQTRPRFIESPFELLIDGARIAGRIDAVYEPAPRRWEVIDFKSGRARPDGPHRVQLEAYALAVRDAGFAPEPPDDVRVAFVYLGDGLTEIGEEVDEEWMTAATDHVAGIVGDARSEIFDPTPSGACRSCDFARFCDEGTAWLDAQV